MSALISRISALLSSSFPSSGSGRTVCSSSRSSSNSCSVTSEKFLTKFSGFRISWATPAVSSPSAASFSCMTIWSCARFKLARASSSCSFLPLSSSASFFHQIEPLDLQGVAAEDLQGRGHVRDLAPPVDHHFRFDIALGHTAHPVREPPQPAQQHAADVEPGDQHRPNDAYHADRKQEIAAGTDRRRGRLSRVLDALACGADQALCLSGELDSKIIVGCEQRRLTLIERKFLSPQIEALAPAQTQIDETGQGGCNPGMERRGSESRQASLDRAGGSLEALLQRFQQGDVGNIERAREKLDRDRRIRLQPRHVAVTVEFLFRQVILARRRRFAEFPIAGHRVEQLVVDSRDQRFRQLSLQRFDLSTQRLASLREQEAFGHRLLDGPDVRNQSAALGTNALEVRLVGTFIRQCRHLRFECLPVMRDIRDGAGEFFRRRCGGKPRSGCHEGTALLCHAERRHHLRDAAFVDAALDLADLIERNQADQTRDDSERDGAPDTQIELGREPIAAVEQPSRQRAHGCAASLSVSMGW